ncbi:hypothetical protein MMC14_009080 [Varicellaria rhodocarpa]|nr:hypothetical protein [Varicellaria rhodocarpa]
MSAQAAPASPMIARELSIPALQLSSAVEGAPSTSETLGPKPTPTVYLGNKTLKGLARRTLGIILLLITVFLWTASNFLASTIFADDSFSKPYFVTYINTSFFSVFLPLILAKRLWIANGSIADVLRGKGRNSNYTPLKTAEHEAFLKPNALEESRVGTPILQTQSEHGDSISLDEATIQGRADSVEDKLDVRETARLGLEFSFLWFAANYFVAACLSYTTVASSTIITSTSSIWTFLFGALTRVESFTINKLAGVLASLAGIVLISTVDLSADNDKNRGSFPHKSHAQIAVGDALALASAIFYGLYTVLMKKRIGDETRVNMPLFFGFVGLLNLLLLWPGFFILHYSGVEEFEVPPTRRIWAIILINSATSLVSDFCWAYAMLLTSPLIVTVGLSLSIPLSLIGQMIINSQQSSFAYWIGAGVVFLSFVFINNETQGEDSQIACAE